jgi:biotin carboxylase
MRKRLRIFDPKHTPKFTIIKSNTKDERKRVIEKVGFPMIIKPTNLAASALVSICYHEEELDKTLRTAFRKLKAKYQSDNRIEVPKLMAEEYIEGVMYSVDSYVGARGTVHHCPLVKVTTGKNIGHDDFYNYLRVTPTNLKKESVEKALERVELAIHALGLRSTTTHTELLYIDGDWKIIEVGPRIGGHRHVLHELSCDIDHSLNDLLIRIPNKPIIPKKCKGFAAVMRYYAGEEGKVEQMIGLKKIQEIDSFKSLEVKAKIGDRVYFAKNGGKGIFDLTLYNPDRSKLLADIRRVEQLVDIKIAGRKTGLKKTTKSTTKKKSS